MASEEKVEVSSRIRHFDSLADAHESRQLMQRHPERHPYTGETVRNEKRVINVVLLGKTGSGKSATGNSLLGREAFQLSNMVASETKTGTVESSEFEDFILNVVDMPGINDTNVSLEETLEEIYDAMSLCPEGFDALVYVLSFPLKFTEEETKVLKILKKTIGNSFTTEFCVVVMAKGDTFVIDNEERGEEFTFDIWLKEQKEPKHFRRFIKEIKSKVVLFYNRGSISKKTDKHL